MAESEKKLKSLLIKVKVESEKVGLKLTILKTKIMASSLITSWQIDGETVETVANLTHIQCPTSMLLCYEPFSRWLEKALHLISQTTSFFWVRN